MRVTAAIYRIASLPAVLCLFAFTASVPTELLLAQAPTPIDITRRSEELMRGKTSTGTYSLRIIRPDWERTIVFDVWAEGTDKAFIRIKEPVKERGVSFLKLQREMWQYIPRINRVIKIPPSMMMQSWMGSGFTNDDLVNESSLITDYEHELLGVEETESGEAYKLSLSTKPDAAIAWDRLHYWVRTSDYVPLRAEAFNERGERVRTMTYGDIRSVGGRTIPTRVEIVEERWPDRKTVMVFDDVSFDRPIAASVFTQSNLRRSR